jgi:TusA-related sulfurtransferase
MIISANTKIASLLKHNPDALEALVSLSPRFTKLRNPVLRKIIAARTSIAMASRIGGCSVQDFFNKLLPMGFEIDKALAEPENVNHVVPEFMKNISADNIIELDVRPVIEKAKDPLNIIIDKVRSLEKGQVLKIINSFEPTPLIHLLGKQGFISYAEKIDSGIVNTYFYKKGDNIPVKEIIEKDIAKGWDEILNRFNDKIETIDVRSLEMPLPMHTILEALKKIPPDKALFVYHKRIPVYLLPELEDQQFSYRIKEINDAEVHLLIYKN